ncbi:hypothetical protein BS47DRAFT_1458988 [Hydnum rufescens UP504]|uniref:Uncharacterized protein n=1 Tax=Hydnum rufescens UP504 TaxID=1448309 RepID=A0A9P6AWZ6_9AGAM|nr:hypothetical protein BS47DRAFT_1458988 [Hydnum rufescens UP504]
MYLPGYIQFNDGSSSTIGWIAASNLVAKAWGRKTLYASRLHRWSRVYLADFEDLPKNDMGSWNTSVLMTDEDLKQDIQTHLQSLGPFVSAMDIVRFLDTPMMKACLKCHKGILEHMAQQWMRMMGYRWRKEKKGQYSDGHKRNNVVDYQQNTPKPYAKGDGVSVMVADFVSADYGWLRSPGGETSAYGYFTNDDMLAQVSDAMDILWQHYPADNHIFVFDNAKTHSKHAEDSLLACRMPKGTSRPDANWGLRVNKWDEAGNLVYTRGGKVNKVFKHMGNATFNNKPQPLYFPNNHPTHPSLFKGMAVILEECGYDNVHDLCTQCPEFKCPSGATDCCCRCLLFSQPDFINVDSLLEAHCLNFIEMCWGFAKQLYCKLLPSSAVEDVEHNMVNSLESIPITSIFANRSLWYMDGYCHGLNGKEAAWAMKKYHRHCQIPTDASLEVIQELMQQ